jgi:hypothetical protein
MTPRRLRAGVVVALGLMLSACGGNASAPRTETEPRPGAPAPSPRPTETPEIWPSPEGYEPEPGEGYPNGKRLAARVAATALTYPRGASARQVAKRLGRRTAGVRRLAEAIDPAVDPAMASSARVVYPQLAGVTATTLGAMVVVRQRLSGADGTSRVITRVVDVRLRRDGGPWQLDEIGSVGGRPAGRPDDLPAAARRVLDDPHITLSDTARWDIHRGGIDEGLLRTLGDVAERQRISVSVLRSGHPREVWQTSRPSAHSRGFAADIYAVDGRLVIRQREAGSAAYTLAARLVTGGAAQVGSPWVLAPGGSRSFTDDVHQDHVHVQWSTMP